LARQFQSFSPDQKHRHLPQQMAENVLLLVGTQRNIRQHQIHLVLQKMPRQFIQGAGHDHDFRPGVGKDRLDEIKLEIFRERPTAPMRNTRCCDFGRIAGSDCQEFVTGGENGPPRVPSAIAARVGQAQFTRPRRSNSGSPSQSSKFGQLLAQGGLGDLQFRRRPGHAAMPGNHPEMPQVVVVQPLRVFERRVH
jgi:hypothetical protein